jgi:hypothetical protein
MPCVRESAHRGHTLSKGTQLHIGDTLQGHAAAAAPLLPLGPTLAWHPPLVCAMLQTVSSTSSAVDRMKKLLSAPDKKATILEMAAANEIDQALMDLLTQNIDAARAAEQEDAAKFMEKVKQAAAKYLVTPA